MRTQDAAQGGQELAARGMQMGVDRMCCRRGAVVARVLQACAAWGVLVPRASPREQLCCAEFLGPRPARGAGSAPGEARRVDARGLRGASARRARLHVIWCDSKRTNRMNEHNAVIGSSSSGTVGVQLSQQVRRPQALPRRPRVILVALVTRGVAAAGLPPGGGSQLRQQRPREHAVVEGGVHASGHGPVEAVGGEVEAARVKDAEVAWLERHRRHRLVEQERPLRVVERAVHRHARREQLGARLQLQAPLRLSRRRRAPPLRCLGRASAASSWV